MTMIDEAALAASLAEAGEAFAIPEGAVERILAASRTPKPEGQSSLPQRLVPHSGRGRVLLAAALVLVVGGTTLAVLPTRGAKTHSLASSTAPEASTGHRSAASGSVAGTPAGGQSSGGAGGRLSVGTTAAPGVTSTNSSGHSSVPALPAGAVGQSAKVETRGSVAVTIGGGTLQSVLGKLADLVAGDGGFVASTQAQIGGSGSTGPSSGTVVLQVPEASFATMLAQVQRVGHGTSVTTTSTDVAGQYVDLQARITALQASRQQYLTIMGQATSIGDILAVQSQLDTLQSQIEQLQGQLSVLDNETTYGTLTVSLTEAGHRSTAPPKPESGITKAWHDGIGGFVSGFEWLIRIAGPALFVLLCLAALSFLGRWAWRATRRRAL